MTTASVRPSRSAFALFLTSTILTLGLYTAIDAEVTSDPSARTLIPLRGPASEQTLTERLGRGPAGDLDNQIDRRIGGSPIAKGNRPGSILYNFSDGIEVSSRPSLDGIPVESVIITTEEFASAFQRLADWKNRSGIPTTVRAVEWIYQEYPHGVDRQERIRSFLQDAYRYWGTRSLVIGGGPDHVPVRHAHDYSWNGQNGGTSIVTDYYYACLDGNWNANGNDRYGEPPISSYQIPSDHTDLIPELEVGRIPCDTLEEAGRYLDNYLGYVLDPASGYLDHVAVLGEVLFELSWELGDCDDCDDCDDNTVPCASDDGAEDCIELIEDLSASEPGEFFRFTELYERDYWWRELGRPNAEPLRLDATLQALDQGVHVLFHSGHGKSDYWGLGPDQLLTRQLGARPAGGPLERSPGLVYAGNASFAGNVELDCMAEAFLFAPRNGALLAVASSNLDFPNSLRTFQQYFFSTWPGNGGADPGDAFYYTAAVFGESVTEIRSPNRFALFAMEFLGDPDLPLWTAEPTHPTVSLPAEVELGSGAVEIEVALGGEALSGARVSLYKADDALTVGLTDAAGHVSLPFAPGTTGEFLVTVTHPLARPYLGESEVVSTGDAFLTLWDVLLDDAEDPGAGIHGNGNGQIEMGETVALGFRYENIGQSAASDARATFLLSEDLDGAELVLLDGTEPLGTVAPGESGEAPHAFLFQVRETALGASPPGVLPLASTTEQTAFEASAGGNSRTDDDLPGRVVLPIQIQLETQDGTSLHPYESFAHRPRLELYDLSLLEVIGNGDGEPAVGEVFEARFDLYNTGSGAGSSLIGRLRALDPNSIQIDVGEATFTDAAPGGHGISGTFRFSLLQIDGHELELEVTDPLGPCVRFLREFDLDRPQPPTAPEVTADAASVSFLWEVAEGGAIHAHRLYRALGGPSPVGSEREFELLADGWMPIASEEASSGHYIDQGLPPRTQFAYKLTAIGRNGRESEPSSIVEASTSPPLLPGWPIRLGEGRDNVPAIADLDGDGTLELLFATDALYAFHSDGSEYHDGDGNPVTLGNLTGSQDGYLFFSKPAVANLLGDSRKEIVAIPNRTSSFSEAREPYLTLYSDQGETLWRQALGPWVVVSSPAVGNIDADPEPEIVVLSGPSVYALDADGTPLGLSPVLLTLPSEDAFFLYGSVSLANVDEDPESEILFTTRTPTINGGRFHAINGDGSPVAGFPYAYDDPWDSSNASPAVVDVSPESRPGVSSEPMPEIFITTRRGVWMFDPGESDPLGWHRQIEIYPTVELNSSPAVGDLNRDGRFEVVVTGGRGRLYVLDALTGEPLPEFQGPGVDYLEVSGDGLGSPLIVDLDGDGRPEIVVGDDVGRIHALQSDGSGIPGFPYPTGRRITHGLNVRDVDGDGSANLVIQGIGRNVQILDLGPGTYDRTDALSRPWPEFRHDVRNLGRIERNPSSQPEDDPLDQDGDVALTEDPPAAHLSFAVHPILPNPTLGRVQCSFDLPAATEVSVSIISPAGRRIRSLVQGRLEAGRHEVPWDARDDRGNRVSAGIYFLEVHAAGVGEQARKVTLLE